MTHFLYLNNPPSGNLLPIIPWLDLSLYNFHDLVIYYLNSRSERLRCTNTVTNNTGLFIGGGSEEIYTIHLICFIA